MEKSENRHKVEGDIREIKFGDVITFIEAPEDFKSIIFNVGEREWFSAADIYKNGEEEVLFFPDTFRLNEIKQIVGHWDFERIKKALESGRRGQLAQETLDLLIGYETNGARTISQEDFEAAIRRAEGQRAKSKKLRKLRIITIQSKYLE